MQKRSLLLQITLDRVLSPGRLNPPSFQFKRTSCSTPFSRIDLSGATGILSVPFSPLWNSLTPTPITESLLLSHLFNKPIKLYLYIQPLSLVQVGCSSPRWSYRTWSCESSDDCFDNSSDLIFWMNWYPVQRMPAVLFGFRKERLPSSGQIPKITFLLLLLLAVHSQAIYRFPILASILCQRIKYTRSWIF